MHAASRPLVGTVLDGKFQIEKALASGASGDVYEAEHLGLGARVAVKVLRPGAPTTAEVRRKRFMREARVAAKLQSDHVVRVFDIVAPATGPTYIVMELLQGETLQQRVQRLGPLPIGEAVDAIVQAAKPLAEMHDLGIVHRDVKPSNLFLVRDKDGNERIKLLDFGVAAFQQSGAPAVRERSNSSLTLTESVIGTPRYMPPEQVRSSKDLDARADVWALGVTLYVLLTGRAPFDGETVLAVLNQIENQDPPPVTSLRPDVPARLAAVVHRCLAKDPAQRPADARGLFGALLPFASARVTGSPREPSALDLSLSDDDVQVVRPTPAPPTTVAPPAPARKIPPRGWALGAAAIAVTILAIALLAHGTKAETTTPEAISAPAASPVPAAVAAPPAPVLAPPSPPAVPVAAPAPSPVAPATADRVDRGERTERAAPRRAPKARPAPRTPKPPQDDDRIE
jgi:serine/threonine-protein kinase